MLEKKNISLNPIASISPASISRDTVISEFESGQASVRNLQELCEDGEVITYIPIVVQSYKEFSYCF